MFAERLVSIWRNKIHLSPMSNTEHARHMSLEIRMIIELKYSDIKRTKIGMTKCRLNINTFWKSWWHPTELNKYRTSKHELNKTWISAVWQSTRGARTVISELYIHTSKGLWHRSLTKNIGWMVYGIRQLGHMLRHQTGSVGHCPRVIQNQ